MSSERRCPKHRRRRAEYPRLEVRHTFQVISLQLGQPRPASDDETSQTGDEIPIY